LSWGIAGLATAGVVVRPWRLPEAVWAVLGALALIAFGLLPLGDALKAVGKGEDVYLFLTGMMLLAELARLEGLFDYLAGLAAAQARGSGHRLFALVYAVGIPVTIFLSNDATAVVLTPAVYAVARAANAEPLPYLFVCAFVANAASFVLPISNPANLVLFGNHVPSLLDWFRQFGVASAASVVGTYGALRVAQGRALRRRLATATAAPAIARGGRVAAFGIAVTAIVLLIVSGFGLPLGLPTFMTGLTTAAIVGLAKRRPPWRALRGISWSILPLVAGLFVLVEGLNRSGLVGAVARSLADLAQKSAAAASFGGGIAIGLISNLVNNLPAGLVAGSALSQVQLPARVADGLLIGVDLGPNLSVTGSLATILWLLAIRREGEHVGFWRFLKLGAIVTPPAFLLALAGLAVGG